MKMAMLGQVRNLGCLRNVTGFALSGVLALAGAAGAQVVLDITLDAPDTFAQGETVPVTITIDRTDVTAAPDSDVTAIGAEIALPSGWKLERDADANCDATISDNQVGGVNSTIQVKGSNTTFVDPPANTTCADLPLTGDTLEIFWIPESGGTGDPLPVNFPLIVNATLTTAGCNENINIGATLRYRVGAGAEVTPAPTGGDTIDCTGEVGCVVRGDVDGNGSLSPGDAQLIFNIFLGTGTAVNPECADFCGEGSVTPGDAQNAFNAFLGTPTCELP